MHVLTVFIDVHVLTSTNYIGKVLVYVLRGSIDPQYVTCDTSSRHIVVPLLLYAHVVTTL